MHAAVVVPPIKDFYFTYHRFACLGTETLNAILKKHNIEITYFNFPLLSKKNRNIKLPGVLEYLKPFIIPEETGPLSFFTKYKYYGPELKDCAVQILCSNPDIIFLSCFSFCYAEETILLADEIKKLSEAHIVAGGAGVSAWPEYFIKENSVDYCITGEAEISVPIFLNELKGQHDFKRIPNFYFKKNNEIIPPESIKYTNQDDLIFVLKKTYETKHSIYYSTYLSRGCPKKCSFCTNHLSQGKKFRTIPLRIIKEKLSKIKIPDDNKQIYINFEDDNILFDSDYFVKVLLVFKKYFRGTFFLLENGIDYSLLTRDLLGTFIDSGLKKLNLSLASTNEHILQNENRALDLKRYEEILKIAQINNIPVTSYFICGFKQDTKESVADTLAYLFKLPTELGISLFYAVPGIENFTDKTIFKDRAPRLCAGSSAYPWNNSLSTKTMITAFRLSRFINEVRRNSQNTGPLIKRILGEKTLYTHIKSSSQNKNKIVAVENIDKELVELFFRKLTHTPD